MNIDIKCSNFRSITKSGNGGGIEVCIDVSVGIKECVFNNLTVTVHGGAVYLSANSCVISKCVFIECCSTKHADDNSGWGNAVSVNKKDSNVDNIAVYKCAANSERCSDSSIEFSQQTLAKYINSTLNYGYWGGSGIALLSEATNNTVKFMNVVDPYDHHAIESNYKVLAIFCNFINTTHLRNAIFWSRLDNGIKFDTCIFINTCSKFSSGSRWEAVNCQADSSLESITQTTPNSIDIHVNFIREVDQICISNQIRRLTSSSLVFITMFIC